MNTFKSIDSESYKKIRQLHQSTLITNNLYAKIEEAETKEEIINTFRDDYNITKQRKLLILAYIESNIWRWDREGENTYFNDGQCAVFCFILNNGGIITRTEIKKKIFTDWQIRRELRKLISLKVILSLQLVSTQRNEVLYLIHPKIINEVKT